jgi:hypothetical protein
MAIAIHCKCGKQFKVKDELAGKAVRCPACKGPLRIPGAAPAAAGATRDAAPGGGGGGHDALLRYEEAQKKKQLSAEEEAAYRAEKNKLVESYDQLTGRSGPAGEKKKKGELAETGVKKSTPLTRVADAFGAVFGNLLFKYALIVVVAGAGVLGSVHLVKYVTGYMSTETGPQKPRDERIRDLFKEAEGHIEARRWDEATRCLNEVIRLDPSKEMHRDYTGLKKRLDERK